MNETKEPPMKKSRSPYPLFATAFVALCHTMSIHAQDHDLVAHHASGTSEVPAAASVAVLEAPRAARVLELLPPARQLMVSYVTDSIGLVEVDILDEQGRTVRRSSTTAQAGRNRLPIDVSGLAAGNYVARIGARGAAGIVRFRRD